MPLISWTFLAAAIAVYGGFRLLPSRARPSYLLFASYGMAALLDPLLPVVVLAFTTIGYAGIYASLRMPSGRRGIVTLAVLGAQIAVWSFTKSASSSLSVPPQIVDKAIFDAYAPLISPTIAVGMSFYLLQSLACFLEQQGERDAPSFLEYALLLAFWPKFFAGPVVRSSAFVRWVREDAAPPPSELRSRGILLVLIGVFLKVALASRLASINDPVIAEPSWYNAARVVTFYLYPIQFAIDVTAYLALARGLCLVFGVPLHAFAQSRVGGLPWRLWYPETIEVLRDAVDPVASRIRSRTARVSLLLGTFAALGFWHRLRLEFAACGVATGLVYLLWPRTDVTQASRSWRALVANAFWSFCLLHILAFVLVCMRLESVARGWSFCSQAISSVQQITGALSQVGRGLGVLGEMPDVITEGEAVAPMLLLALLCGGLLSRARLTSLWSKLGESTVLRYCVCYGLFWGSLAFGRFANIPFIYARF